MQPKPRPARDRVNENKLQQIMRKGSGLSGRRVICSRPDRSAGALRSHRMNRAISAFRRSRRDSPSSDRRRRDQGCSAYLIAASSSQPTINRRLRTGPNRFGWVLSSAIEQDSVWQCGRLAGEAGRPRANPGWGGRRARDRVHCICLAIVLVGMSLACASASDRYGLAAFLLQ